MPRKIDFQASAGRESLWTTGEKPQFSWAHCEVQKQPFLVLTFWGLHSSPKLKPQPHLKFLGLDPWPPGSSKSPIFAIFEANLKKYIRNLRAAVDGRAIFGPSTTLRCKNCRGVWTVGQMTLIWNLALHHMECPQLWSHLSRYSQHETEWFLRQTNESFFFSMIIAIRDHRRKAMAIKIQDSTGTA